MATRARLACAPCTRRKVKCSKTTPCSNCIRRGERDSCAPTDLSPRPESQRSHAHTHLQDLSPASSNNTEVDMTEVDMLRNRVAELEAELRRQGQDARGDPRQSLPIDSGPTEAPSEAALTAPNPGGASEQAHTSPTWTAAPASTRSQSDAHADARHRPGSSAQPQAPVDSVVEDAASILEFLAWGRRKNPAYHEVVSPEATVTMRDPGDVHDADPSPAHPDTFEDSLAFIQLLLPSPRQVWQLVDYHQACVLWYHGSYFASTFQRQVQDFYDRFHGNIESPGVNLQWVALLFAVLTGSMTSAPDHKALSWGFRDPERETLSARWFRAVIALLNRAEYSANQSILSVQAIATLTGSAHLLGFSNTQSVHLAAAVKIAQGLGLHRLTHGCSGGPVEVETGRRLWAQLTSQDWFSVPFSESYLVNPLYSQSEPPINCHDEDMRPLPERVPTVTSYCRFLNTIAAIMPRLQDGLLACNTPYTRYEQVLHWDKQLRRLATAERPAFLTHAPLEPGWPAYIPWARRSLAISSGHKIIMIHRSFLSESFTNPAFAFTRRTCLAASKTIIKEYKASADEDGPVLWTHQAFSVAAAIILLLDVLHREPAEQEFRDHRRLADDTVRILRGCKNSMIARRGDKLLSAMLAEVDRRGRGEPEGSRKRKHGDLDGSRVRQQARGLDVSAFVKTFCEGASRPAAEQGPARANDANRGPPATTNLPLAATAADLMLDAAAGIPSFVTDLRPDTANYTYPPPGLEGATYFENLLYLANHDFSIL